MKTTLGVHDVGGDDDLMRTPLDRTDRELQHWELRTHALLVQMVANRLISVDELRRHIEGLSPSEYNSSSYYEKWTLAMCTSCVERGLLTGAAIEKELGRGIELDTLHEFEVGDVVRVREMDEGVGFRRPHLRTPGYVHGAVGVVERVAGTFLNPEYLAFREHGSPQKLYRVRFDMRALWESSIPDRSSAPSSGDTVDVDVVGAWLNLASDQELESFLATNGVVGTSRRVVDGHDDRHEVETTALKREGEPSDYEPLSDALFRLLVAAGTVDASAIQRGVADLEGAQGSHVGAKIVARAWTDEAFKRDLLVDAKATLSRIGISASNYDSDIGHHEGHHHGETVLTAVENISNEVHNVVCCTLCSCYPTAILGLSPAWYKSRVYRARAVRDPRNLLREFGTEIPTDTRIAVHDSTADLRYIVIPERPIGTESMNEAELQSLVTRDSMIGTSHPRVPFDS